MMTILITLIQSLVLFSFMRTGLQFTSDQEESYIFSFSSLIKDSYSADLPSNLLFNCKSQGNSGSYLPVKAITSSMLSSELQNACGQDTICTIESSASITMNSNLNLAALIVKGKFIWNDQSQAANDQWLCAGYVAVQGGEFTMMLNSKKGYIYIKNNNLKHEKLSFRAFGAFEKGRITVVGRKLERTWSLLAQRLMRPVNSISLMHDPQQMGWQKGDRIVIGPNDLNVAGSQGTAEEFYIGAFESNNKIQLVNKYGQRVSTTKRYASETRYVNSDVFALVQAEVINLSRNILITGDDFSHVNGQPHPGLSDDEFDAQQADHCTNFPRVNRKVCTLGLHVIAREPGAVLSLQYTRVEKCGQRGVLGKYCTHLHLIGSCPDCKIIGNAYEYGHQRGTVVHGTHLATVEQNVFNDIRGANIYIEDGNELYNKIYYNVGVCPWSLTGEKHGCTVPGTDNDQADTSLNQAGFWALGFQNYVIGNRFTNSFNGMLYQEQGFGDGRQSTKGKVCNSNQQIGRMEGNTYHHHGRFGTYVLAEIYPKNVQRTIANNGIPLNKQKDCVAWLPDGSDNGKPAVIKNNVDYMNTFVGQYSAGDIQYKNHISLKNSNLIYWKQTKNFQDGCSAHLSNSYYENGNMALPGGHGTFTIENTVFSGEVKFESAHHCNIGASNVLCMPTYLFVNTTWKKNEKSKAIVIWHDAESKPESHGAMFTLGPEDRVDGDALFPKGYRSIIHPYWEYLLELDNKQTCVRESQINEPKEKYIFKNSPLGAILCTKSVRRLEISSFGSDTRNMVLELYENERYLSKIVLKFYRIPGTTRQGYSAVVIPASNLKYKLRMEAGDPSIPKDWIIEFSDVIFSNRWQSDEIKLEVAGRNCPSVLTSQHDRRWIYSGSDNLKNPGRGACSGNPDMPQVNCRSYQLSNTEKCAICQGKSCSNGFCDCGSGQCMCDPGYSGFNCERNVCSSIGCVHGVCSAKYLGGEIPVSLNKCVCEDGWYGENCDSKTKPTPDETSLMHCEGVCKGEFPFGCNSGLDYGYCGRSGGCHYAKNNDSNLCCFKGCDYPTAPGQILNPTVNPIINPTFPMTTIKQEDTTNCNNVCQGSYPYGCNDGFELGYCGKEGGCNYAKNNDPYWCCFKGCGSSKKNNTISCDGVCQGSYPYGCNDGFSSGYCGKSGGCTYSKTNDPYWCCFKGC